VSESEENRADQSPTLHRYTENGLKACTINACSEVCFYFYDLDDRLIIEIDGQGSIMETTYNSWNESIQVRRYKAGLSGKELERRAPHA
jgi:YD repeat-containing protein